MSKRKISFIVTIILSLGLLTSCYKEEEYISKRGDKKVDTAFSKQDTEEIETETQAQSEQAPPESEEEQETQTEGRYGRTTATSVNLRSQADTTSPIIKVLSRGTRLEILGTESVEGESWYKVRTEEGQEGFVLGDYINETGE